MSRADIAVAFGKVMREQRIRAQLTQEHLALAANVDRTFIGMLERGLRQPTLGTLFAIAKALDVTPHTLVAKIEARLFD